MTVTDKFTIQPITRLATRTENRLIITKAKVKPLGANYIITFLKYIPPAYFLWKLQQMLTFFRYWRHGIGRCFQFTWTLPSKLELLNTKDRKKGNEHLIST